MGVPLISAQEVLHSILMIRSVHRYVMDSGEEMAKQAILLLIDSALRRQVSEKCRKSATERYIQLKQVTEN